MLKLMIVDDEPATCRAIAQCINWTELGIEISDICENGIDAYHALQDNTPDLVLTDIRMPVLSGLELIEKAMRISPDIEFVIMSGYSDFAYAQRAMQSGVKHYLLKPCGNEKMVETFRAAARDVREKQERRLAQTFMKRQNEELCLGLLLFALQFCPESPAMLEASLRPLSPEFGKPWMLSSHLAPDDDDECSVLEPTERLKVILRADQLRFILCRTPQLPTASAESRLSSEFPNFATAIEALAKLLSTYHMVELIAPSKRYPLVGLVKRLDRAVELTETDMTSPVRGEVLRSLLDGCEDLRSAQTLVSLFIIRSATDPSEGGETDSRQLYRVWECHTPEQLSALADELFPTGERKRKTPLIVQHCLEYIWQHYGDAELNLRQIANEVLYIHPDYLGKLFRRCEGIKFSEYLARVRMENARRLIEETDDPIRVIAEAVGCGNSPQYFSFLFKKQYGMTPSVFAAGMRER